MDLTCDDVETQLRQLKELTARLGESMDRTADALRSQGLSPSTEFIRDLQNYRDVFLKLRTWLQYQHREFNTDAAEAPRSLRELETRLLDRVGRLRALEFVGALQGISHVDGDRHPSAAMCRQALQAARDEILGTSANGGQTVQGLRQGSHPLAVLRRLLTESDTLNDDQWAELLEQIGTGLGREVATAVARHKLLLVTPEQCSSTENGFVETSGRTIECSQSAN